MTLFLAKQFYQGYFANIEQQKANWLKAVPMEARLNILAHLLQWDIPSLNDNESRGR